MKKFIAILLFFITLLSFTSCNSKTTQPDTSGTSVTDTTVKDDESMKLDLLIVSGTDSGELLLAGEKSSDVYYLTLNNQTHVYIDNEEKSVSDLKDGMYVTVMTDVILESYPAQIGNATIQVSTELQKIHKDYRTLILNILDTLWKDDDALNFEVTKISVDLTNAPAEISEGEKVAFAMSFAKEHNMQPLTYTYDELVSNGFIKKNSFYWEDGILFKIESTGNNKFSASKWRSGDGAIFYTDNTVKWNKDGSVKDIKFGGFAIS